MFSEEYYSALSFAGKQISKTNDRSLFVAHMVVVGSSGGLCFKHTITPTF